MVLQLAPSGWMTRRAQEMKVRSTIVDIANGVPMLATIAAILVSCAHMEVPTSVWLMVDRTLAVLKFTTMGHGVQFMMMVGIKMLPKYCAASLDSPAHFTSTTERNMAKGQGEFGWIFTGVRVGSHRYLLAVTMAGE